MPVHTTNPVLLKVDGTEYRIDLAAVTGTQVKQLRDELGVSFVDLLMRLETNMAELPEVAGLMLIGLQQIGLPADARWLLANVTLGSDVEITQEDDEIDPAVVAAAEAIVARAGAHD